MEILIKLLFTAIVFVIGFGGCLILCIGEELEPRWEAVIEKGFAASICCVFAAVVFIIWTA